MKKRVHDILSVIIPDSIKGIFIKEHRISRERKMRFGEKNPEKTIYVIRFTEGRNRGVAQLMLYVTSHIQYAMDKGYVPVVDFKNYYMPWIQNNCNRHKENAWEYYFMQPQDEVSLDDVYQCKKVILSNMYGRPKGAKYNIIGYDIFDRDIVEKWGAIFRKYIRLRPEIERDVIKFENDHFRGHRVLGVSWRVAMSNGIVGHPMQASLEEYISSIEEYMKKWEMDKVFLSIDDSEKRELLCEHFGNKCLYIKRPLWAFYDKQGKFHMQETLLPVEMIDNDGQINNERNSYYYLMEICLLARCTSLLSGISGGSQAAILLNNNKYENIFIFDKGISG